MRMKAKLMYFGVLSSLLAFHGAPLLNAALQFLPSGMGDGHL